jgi:tetratricopeptide (TPR) repeat protein
LLIALLILALGDSLAEGQRAFQAGDLARAESLFRDYLKTNPRSAEATSNLAAVLARREQFPEAIALYRQALKLNPQLVEIRFNLGVAQMRAADYAGCAESFAKFLARYPQETRALQLRGLCLVESGDLEGGIAALEKAPLEAAAIFALAYAHSQAGDEARATELLRQLESRPAQARLVEGLLEYRRANYIVAKEKFQAAVAADPNLAPALAGLGRVALLDNRDEEAMTYFRRALAIAPHDAEATYQLGVLEGRNGREAEARRLLERALALRANYADPHYQLAQLDFRAKRYNAALRHLEIAVKILPNQDSIRLLLARTYQALGREADAAREFAAVRRLKQQRIERDRIKQ